MSAEEGLLVSVDGSLVVSSESAMEDCGALSPGGEETAANAYSFSVTASWLKDKVSYD